jgi:hypothetical protein
MRRTDFTSSLNFALSKAKSQCYYHFLYLSSAEIVNGCKAKQTTAIKYCKSEQIKATMLKHTRQNRISLFTLLRHIPDYFSYHLQSGVIFAPRRVPDYCGVV